jgi:hypothetical protein
MRLAQHNEDPLSAPAGIVDLLEPASFPDPFDEDITS